MHSYAHITCNLKQAAKIVFFFDIRKFNTTFSKNNKIICIIENKIVPLQPQREESSILFK